MCIECVCRNAQRHSSENNRHSSDDYATLDSQARGQQPQYDVIPLDKQPSSAADAFEYVEL